MWGLRPPDTVITNTLGCELFCDGCTANTPITWMIETIILPFLIHIWIEREGIQLLGQAMIFRSGLQHKTKCCLINIFITVKCSFSTHWRSQVYPQYGATSKRFFNLQFFKHSETNARGRCEAPLNGGNILNLWWKKKNRFCAPLYSSYPNNYYIVRQLPKWVTQITWEWM